MTEPRVCIAQCLCSPARHCILAASGMADEAEAQRLVAQPLQNAIDQLVAAGAINPWCGLCGSPMEQWFIEVGRTAFKTMEEAAPHLAEMQERNALANAMLGGHPGPGKAH